MSRSCATPIAFEQLVDYWTTELDATMAEAIEEHLFGCELCTAEMERVHGIVTVFRDHLPPVISVEQLAELRASGLRIEENTFEPGRRREVTFPTTRLDFMIHHLAGLALGDATRVSVTVRSEASGVMHEDPFAPFDRERGEVLIACQKHFAAFPPDIVVDVRVHRAAVAELATYPIPHVFVR